MGKPVCRSGTVVVTMSEKPVEPATKGTWAKTAVDEKLAGTLRSDGDAVLTEASVKFTFTPTQVPPGTVLPPPTEVTLTLKATGSVLLAGKLPLRHGDIERHESLLHELRVDSADSTLTAD